MIRQSPRACGLARSRWWLGGLQQAVDWLKRCSLPGIWRILKRLRLHYRRGREYLHSPDPDYEQKLATILAARQAAQDDPDSIIFLYEDELTYYRRPSVGYSYAPAGSTDPRAVLGIGSNTKRRVAACLNVHSGQLLSWQRSTFNRWTFIRFLRFVQSCYPAARHIYIALDNWSVHFHNDVLRSLAKTRITLLPLPTYAPWTNPVERVWRLLKHQLLHLHDFADDWLALTSAVDRWLERYRTPSPLLLRSAGL